MWGIPGLAEKLLASLDGICFMELPNKVVDIISTLLSPTKIIPKYHSINPLTQELNPSAQRCLKRIFTGDFAS
jgi:hypothetical protein